MLIFGIVHKYDIITEQVNKEKGHISSLLWIEAIFKCFLC